MTERLIIDHVGHFGDGVAVSGGETLYVPYALGGETVDVLPSPGHPDRRALAHVVTTSPQRIDPFCPHFGTCGGCAIQHWQDDAYRNWKRQLVVDTLNHAGIGCEVLELIDAHGTGRRRMTLHARQSQQGILRVGFAAAGRHEIIAIDHCPILDPAMHGAIEAANDIAELLRPVSKPLDIQITAADNGLDVDVRGSGPLGTALLMSLSKLAEKHNLARLTRHGELVIMRKPPVVRVGKAQVTLPAGSFMQPTAVGEETLAALAFERCKGAKHIADLFCGFGPFAFRLAEKFKVAAFDSDAAAVTALQNAVKLTQGLKPIKAEARDLFRRPLMPQELRDYDCVVFDPPRQGAQAQSQQLAASKIALAVAVSCNPATFARDARILIDGGFKIDSVTPVDQFRHTPHVELVAKFRR
ncbi:MULTISPECIES: methyltransferase [unclassified Afipia]|uniref:class I SAM-dependent RNA methyltransferase n=1 Tax=unclassified Afipia TaxID=2642050 RepID=UPI0004638BA7|nr:MULTISPECIES: methyltransferase [unclassified Afipia]MAH71206.1 class I SAM-dependent RNA methyltransferase [Afipia sp.]OUX59730.1 MAG: class I SAM-dependent RNA methyltransferase [Afipia sp. TMED4]HAQ92703.1 class I SAM-dependent RNA methyltransferase [Afipia sp.]HCX16633.1 class I SAM-dependent RNA methyltransferase [Afipia sp.]